jgi:hypothetical protein
MLTTYLDKPGYTWNSRALTLIPACGFLTAAGLAWLSTWAALGVDIEFPLPITGVSYRLQYQLSCQPGHSDHDVPAGAGAGHHPQREAQPQIVLPRPTGHFQGEII